MRLDNEEFVNTQACLLDQEGIGAVALDIKTGGGIYCRLVDKEAAGTEADHEINDIVGGHGKGMAAGRRVVNRYQAYGYGTKADRGIACSAACNAGYGSATQELGVCNVSENEA